MNVSEKLIRLARGTWAAALVAALGWAVLPVAAQVTYFTDFNGATAGFGTNANLTWSTGTATWTTNAGGTAATVNWPAAAANNNAVLGHGTGTGTYVATLGSAISVGNISTTNGTWTVNTNGNVLTFNGTTAATPAVTFNGTGGITKNNTNTVTLNGANSYSGNTTVSAGTLAFGSNTAAGTGTIVLAGGTVSASGGDRTLTNNVLLNTTNSTIGGADNIVFSGNFQQTGSRTLNITNTGLTTFQTGTFTLAENNQARTLTLNVSGSSGGLVVHNLIANGPGSGVDSIVKTGAGNLSLTNAASTYNGTTVVNDGRLIVGTLANGSTASSIGTGASNPIITLGNTTTTGILSFNGTGIQSTNRRINLGGSTGGATLEVANTGNITFANTTAVTSSVAGTKNLTLAGSGSGTGTVSGVIQNGTGVLNLIKDGPATWVLSGTNTYTGTTSIRDGVLSVNTLANVGVNSALGAPALANATISLGNGTTSGTLQFTGTTANSTNRVLSLAGSTGGGAIEVTGAGNLTFTGGLSAAAAGTKNITLNATATGEGFYNGTISNGSGTVGVVKTGDGTWTLGASNTFTGTVNVTNGILSLANTGAVASASSLNVESGATLRLASGNATATGTLTINGTGEGGIGAIQGANTLAGFSGNITLAGNSTITSLTSGGTNETIIGQFVSPLTRPPVDPTTINLGAHTLTFGGGTGSSIFTLAGKAVGTGGITLDLNNAADSVYFSAHQNTYTGLTTIKQGTLLPFTLPNTYPGDSAGGGGVDQFFGITGNIQIGDGDGAANTAILHISDALGSSRTNELINYKSRVTMYADGQLKVNSAQTFGGYDATFNPGDGTVGQSFIFNGGTIDIGTNGALYLMGDVKVNATANTTATINGVGNTLSLTQHQGPAPVPNADRKFDVERHASSAPSHVSDLTINAKIMNGSITKLGNGTMTITGNNTGGYEGTTTINNGILAITHEGALGQGLSDAASGTRVNSGGTLRLVDTLTLLGATGVENENLYLNGTGFNPGTGALGALQHQTGTNTWAGTVILETASSIQSSAGLLTLSGAVTSATNSGLTVFGSGNTTISGAIGTGSGTLTKQGSGTLILSGSNTYSGLTTVSEGVLSVQNNNALGSASAGTVVSANAALQLSNVASGNLTTLAEPLSLNGLGVGGSGGALRNIAGNNNFQGPVTIASTARINSDAHTMTLSGGITSSDVGLTIGGAGHTTVSNTSTSIINLGAGSLTKDGAGTLTFTGPASATGTVGAVNLSGGNMVVGTGSTLTLGTAEFASSSGTTLTIASGGTVNANYGTGTETFFSGDMAGSGTFTKTGAGTLVFNAKAGFDASSLSLVLSGGTVRFTNTNTVSPETPWNGSDPANTSRFQFGTIYITGNTILDFDNSAGTFLSSANLVISPGITVTVNNWISVAGTAASSTIWYATNASGGISAPGGVNAINLPPTQVGAGVLPQVVFSNYSGLTTTWVSGTPNGWFDREIRPTPEPATYGAIFLGSCFGLIGWRRYRRRKSAGAPR